MTENRTTLEIIAPSVEEAVEQGLQDLGLPEEAVEVEVLDSGSKGLFGIGGRQVRIRLTVKDQSARPTPVVEEKTDKAIEPESTDDVIVRSKQVVNDLLEKMGITASVSSHFGEVNEEGEQAVLVDIHGDDLGILIGRRAEILNAMQYLVNLIVSKQVGHWVQVIIDVEGYRTRRERQLRQLAQRMADQALRTGRRQVLEPMSPAERRIIHIELRDHPTVTTQSVGEEPVRKVTIMPK